MHTAFKILPVAALLGACITAPEPVSSSPGSIQLVAPFWSSSQAVTDQAQTHCARHGRDAVLVSQHGERLDLIGTPGKVMLFHCRG